MWDFSGKKTEPADVGEPIEGFSVTILDHLIKGFVLIFPLVFFREMVFPGFTEQDVYFCAFAALILLISIIVAWRNGAGHVRAVPYTILGLACWSIVCIAVCVWQILQQDEMAYRLAYYAAGLMLVIALRTAGLRSRRYLELFTIPLCIIYGFLVYYGFTGSETVFGIEALIKAPGEFIPFLILGCITASILFATTTGVVWRILYGFIYIAGAELMVMYGNMLSWCLLGAGTLSVILFMLLLPIYSKGRRVIKLLIVLSGLIIACLLAVLVFLKAGNGEWWYPVQRYGVHGLYVLSAAVISFFIMMRADRTVIRDADVPWVIIAVIYLIQAFFYPLSVISMPIWLIYLAGAIPAPAMAYAPVTAGSGVEAANDEGQSVTPDDDDELEFLDLDDIDFTTQDAATPEEASASGDSVSPDTSGKRDARATVVRARRRLKTDRMKEITLHTGLTVAAVSCIAMLAIMVVISIRGRSMSAEELSGNPTGSEASMTQVDSDDVAGGDATGSVDFAGASGGGSATNPVAADDASYGGVDVASMTDYDPDDLGIDISEIDWSALGIDMGDSVDVAAMGADAVDEAGDDDAESTTVSISNGDYTIYDPNATYKKCNDIVAPASGSTRLRSEPSIGDEGVVVHVLESDERVVRDGLGDNGWSRVKYRGRTCYAVTEYLSVQGTYHGDPSELIVETETPDDADQATADGSKQTGADTSQTQTTNASANAKGKSAPAGYSIQWSADNKTCTIWSAGVKQGSLSVTDGTESQKINVYSDYHTGSGKNDRKYLSISVPAGENQLSLSADSGFMSALKNMGYSGVYFNKQVIDW